MSELSSLLLAAPSESMIRKVLTAMIFIAGPSFLVVLGLAAVAVALAAAVTAVYSATDDAKQRMTPGGALALGLASVIAPIVALGVFVVIAAATQVLANFLMIFVPPKPETTDELITIAEFPAKTLAFDTSAVARASSEIEIFSAPTDPKVSRYKRVARWGVSPIVRETPSSESHFYVAQRNLLVESSAATPAGGGGNASKMTAYALLQFDATKTAQVIPTTEKLMEQCLSYGGCKGLAYGELYTVGHAKIAWANDSELVQDWGAKLANGPNTSVGATAKQKDSAKFTHTIGTRDKPQPIAVTLRDLPCNDIDAATVFVDGMSVCPHNGLWQVEAFLVPPGAAAGTTADSICKAKGGYARGIRFQNRVDFCIKPVTTPSAMTSQPASAFHSTGSVGVELLSDASGKQYVTSKPGVGGARLMFEMPLKSDGRYAILAMVASPDARPLRAVANSQDLAVEPTAGQSTGGGAATDVRPVMLGVFTAYTPQLSLAMSPAAGGALPNIYYVLVVPVDDAILADPNALFTPFMSD